MERIKFKPKDLSELIRILFLKDNYKNRFLLSWNFDYLNKYKEYLELEITTKTKLMEKYNLQNKKIISFNFSNYFMEVEEN